MFGEKKVFQLGIKNFLGVLVGGKLIAWLLYKHRIFSAIDANNETCLLVQY